jgi:malonyl-CoA/methylmalonyl-CoA synthetase
MTLTHYAAATGILPEEALYFMQKCKSTTILASRDHLELGAQLQHHATSNGLPTTLLPIHTNLSPTIDPTSPLIAVSPAIEISPHRPGLLLFTSGTTGPPKGVIHARRLFYNMRRASSSTDVFLSHCPPHWIGGTLPLIRHPLAGVRVEMIPSDPSVIWNRLRDGGVTIFLGPPRLWTLMMRHFQDRIATNLPSDVVDAYVRGARQLRVAHVTGSMPYNALLRFWREDIGRPLQVSYGSTELGGRGLTVTADTDITLEVCCFALFSS